MENEAALSVGIAFDTETGDTEAKIKKVETCIGDIGKASVKAGEGIGKLPKKVGEEAGKTLVTLEALNKKIQSIQKGLQPLAKAGKYTFLGLTGAAALSVKKFADFEASILKVRTISKKSFEGIESDVRNLSKKYGLSTASIAEGNYQLVSSMGDVKESAQILDTTAKLSIAGFTDYASAMNGLVAVMNGYKLEAKEAGNVADILMTVQNRGVTTINELQGSLAEVTSIAYNAKVGFKDIAAAMATITSNKVGTAEAVTGLKGAILELMQDGSQAAKHFKKATGEAFDKFMNNHSLVEAIQTLDEYSKKTGISLANIFGNVRAGTAFMNLAGDNLKKFTEDLKAMNNATGTADAGMKELDKGAKRTFEKLKAQVEDTVIAIGKSLVPQVRELTDKLSKIDWNKVFSQENINKIVSTGKKIAIMGGALWTVNIALSAVLKVSSAIMTGQTFIAWLAKGGAGVSAFLKLAGAGGVAAGVGAGGYLAYKSNQIMNETVNHRADTSGMRLKEAKVAIEKDIETTKKQILNLKQAVEQAEDLGGNSVSMLETAKNKLKDLEKKHLENEIALKNEYYNEVLAVGREKYKLASEQLKKEEPEGGIKLAPGYADQDKKGKSKKDELKEFIKEYEKEMQNLPKFWDLIGLSQKEKLEEYLSFFKGKLQGAIELGSQSLTSLFSKSFQETKSKLNDMSAKEILGKYNLNSSTHGKELTGSALFQKEIDNTREAINALKELSNEKYAQDISELEQREEYLKKNQEKFTEEEKARKKHIASINAAINGLSTLSSAFLSMGTTTGSSTLSGIGGILGNFANIGKATKDFGSFAEIGKIFSKGGFSAGATSLGALASGVAAGVGIVTTIGSLFGKSGKKKAAAIDNRNKENEADYKKQVQAMEQLTQALQQNSERIKTFADRMLTDVAKNPTIKMIGGGESNFDLLHSSMIAGKHFNDISALEKGSASYRKMFRKKSKDTYTKVNIGEGQLLKYLGFDKTELDAFTDNEMKQLDNVLNQVNHEALRRATGRNLTESNIDEWKKQVHEFVTQIKFLENEKSKLFKGATLESFTGVEYKSEKELIKEYTEQFKQMGMVGEQYNQVIKDMARNNQVLITSMQDVRQGTIEGFANSTGGFLNSAKTYFEKIYKNASSVAYDVLFSDIDSYMSSMFETISNKLVGIKKNGKLDFSGLFAGFDFEKLKLAELNEKQARKSLDVIKRELLESGVDLSIINKILPKSDFNDRINDLKSALSAGMSSGLEDHKFSSFTQNLGKSLYDSMKNSVVKVFSESSLYQGLIQKFIKAEDIQGQLEKAGSFKEAFGLAEGIMKKFGYELEAAGFGGFDAVNNLAKPDTNLGNAYYADKASNVEMNFYITQNGDIYGMDDFRGTVKKMWTECYEAEKKKPKGYL